MIEEIILIAWYKYQYIHGLNPLFTRGGGTFTLPTFKSPTLLRARIFLVQNHLVNSYLCIDGVSRPFLGHFDATPKV